MKPHIVSWDELLYSVSVSVSVLSCQPSCNIRCNMAVVFKLVRAKIWFQRRKRIDHKAKNLLDAIKIIVYLQARSQNCEKGLLSSSCLSVLPSVSMEQSVPTERTFIKFDIQGFLENQSRKLKFH